MRIYKQRPEKKKTSSILTGFFALILILSIFSITNVYAIDNETITGYVDTNDEISLNDKNHAANFDIQTSDTPPKLTEMEYKRPKHLNENDKNNDVSYAEGNNQGKIDGKATVIDRDDSKGFHFNIDFYDSNSKGNLNDIGDYVNQDIVLIISSNSQGNNLENFNNFIKKVANINFNKIDNDEDILILEDYQSSSHRTLTILFFIKIFMDFHNNGKEHLNSF